MKLKMNIGQQLENSWGDIEKYAIMKKENDLLLKLITKLKHNTFIKYYN